MTVIIDQDGVCKIMGNRAGFLGVYPVEDPDAASRVLMSRREGNDDWHVICSRSHGIVLEQSVVLYNGQTTEIVEWIVGLDGKYLGQRPLTRADVVPFMTALEHA